MALNFTPCVYPMVPITVAFFSQQGGGKTARVLFLALLYVLGIAITYSTLGVVAALTGRMFGEHLQSPWVSARVDYEGFAWGQPRHYGHAVLYPLVVQLSRQQPEP